MIICPKCGKVEIYSIKEYVHRVGLFHEDGECYETTEDIGFRYGKPRCYECGSMVRFYSDPFEDVSEVEE